MVSRRSPGTLFEMGLERVREDLAALQGQGTPGPDPEDMRRVMTFYHAVLFMPHHAGIGDHAAQEMKTLAEIMDCLVDGQLDRLGDIAMQRYKALACATDEGNWALASEVEIVDNRQRSLLTDEERMRGTRRQLANARLATSLQSLRQRASGASNRG